MPHLRKEIRAHVVNLLKNGNTLAGDRVYPSQVRPGIRMTFPMIAVYTPEESVTIKGINPHVYERNLELIIECISEDINTDVENRLDTLLNEIESLIDTDETMLPNVSEIEYAGSSVNLFNTGEKNTASGVIKYVIKYYTEEELPEVGDLENIEINGKWLKPLEP